MSKEKGELCSRAGDENNLGRQECLGSCQTVAFALNRTLSVVGWTECIVSRAGL